MVEHERENPAPHRAGLVQAAAAETQSWQLLAEQADLETEYLRELAGVERLEDATYLQLVVSSASSSISHLGTALPNLQELHLNNSVLETLRDLGNGFAKLQILWVSRCGLRALDGLQALTSLRELYASYNDISDLHPVGACVHLEVLDVEGNCIRDAHNIAYLCACTSLQLLTLSGNPVVEQTPNYRQIVCSQLRALRALDDLQVTDSERIISVQSKPGATAKGAPGRSGALAPAAPAAGADGRQQQDQELAFVLHGIKHARVGLDSQEFKEIEMSLLVAAADGHADVALDGSRPGTGSLLPASAGTWMRTLRSSREGSLAALRASHQGPLPANDSPVSTTPTSASPSASRPSSSQLQLGGHAHGHHGAGAGPGPLSPAPDPLLLTTGSVGRRPSSNPSGAPDSPLPPRPATANLARPFSGRPGTASGAARLGTSASTSAAATAGAAAGLYWSKHRLGSAGSDSAGPSGLPMVEDVAEEPASHLTFGSGGSFGGSLAKDLRRWKGGSSRDGTVIGSGGGGSAAAAGGGRNGHAGGGGSLLQGLACNGSGQVDYGALLDELKRWKVETADKVLAEPEGEAASSDDWMLRGSRGSGGDTDILRLSISQEGNEYGGDEAGPDTPGSPVVLPGSPSTPQHALGPLHLPPKGPSGAQRKMVLSKVVRDVGELGPLQVLPHQQPQGAQQQQQHGRTPHHSSGGAADGSVMGRHGTSRLSSGGPAPGGDPHARASSARSRSSSLGHSDHGIDVISAVSASSRPGSREVPDAHAGSVVSVVSVAGEMDVRTANPRPIRRMDSGVEEQ